MVPLTIRHAQLGDADRLGAIQVRAWQAAYRGVMPDAYLDELDVDDRAAYWHRQVLALLPGQRLKVIVDDGVVVGFAAAGPEHDGRAAVIGELYAINLDPQVWGRGLGQALLRDVTAELAGLGYLEAVLWVVPRTTGHAGSTSPSSGATTTYDATMRSSGSSFPRCATGAHCPPAAQVRPKTTAITTTRRICLRRSAGVGIWFRDLPEVDTTIEHDGVPLGGPGEWGEAALGSTPHHDNVVTTSAISSKMLR